MELKYTGFWWGGGCFLFFYTLGYGVILPFASSPPYETCQVQNRGMLGLEGDLGNVLALCPRSTAETRRTSELEGHAQHHSAGSARVLRVSPPLPCSQSLPSASFTQPFPLLLPRAHENKGGRHLSSSTLQRTARRQLRGVRARRAHAAGRGRASAGARAHGDAGPGGASPRPAPAGRPRPRRARLAGVKSRLRLRKAAGEGRPGRAPTSSLRCARNVGTVP